MIRVVDYRKAALAGAAGAAAWEAAVRVLDLVGLPVFDIVRQLGTLVAPNGPAAYWWAAGMLAHALVGICWAAFYAYFLWARLPVRPALQGLIFAALPALLAITIATPQLILMHSPRETVDIDWWTLLMPPDLGVVAGLLVGHAAFGLTVGAIYTHPVGYSATDPPDLKLAPAGKRSGRRRERSPANFIFATGIEGSYPTIEHGRWRRDQMLSGRHYQNWERDFELCREIGITHLRYGPPLHLSFKGPASYDWSLVDEPMEALRELGPEPIVDLCHFGVPSWLENFQNPEIADALAEFADAFARRYPWVRFYTPVNEMFVCARNSTLNGIWNEQEQTEPAFVNAVFNMARASIAMSDAILKQRPDAIFINSESSEFCQPCCPDPEIEHIAMFENERRFLPLDLIYAHEVSGVMRDFLREHGIEDRDLAPFMNREVPRRSVLGVDYYEWNERLIDQNGDSRALGTLFGWYVIASQYYERYQRTMMYTETNRKDAEDAPRWLWSQWHNLQLLRSTGVPIVGFTWYSLTDQVDWNIGMEEALGIVYPVGLFDLNRDARLVGLAYKDLIDMYADHPEYRECAALKELLQQ